MLKAIDILTNQYMFWFVHSASFWQHRKQIAQCFCSRIQDGQKKTKNKTKQIDGSETENKKMKRMHDGPDCHFRTGRVWFWNNFKDFIIIMGKQSRSNLEWGEVRLHFVLHRQITLQLKWITNSVCFFVCIRNFFAQIYLQIDIWSLTS
jgi:hypothetical protein